MENWFLYTIIGLLLGGFIAFIWDELERTTTISNQQRLRNSAMQEHEIISKELELSSDHKDPAKQAAIEKSYRFCLTQNSFTLKDVERITLEIQQWYHEQTENDSVYRINFPEKELLILSPLQTLNLLKIINEGLHNAATHSQANFIFSIASVEDDRLHIITHDNGVGYDRKEIPDGKGIQSIIDSTYQLKGKLNLTSTIGNGTVVNVEIPLSKENFKSNNTKYHITQLTPQSLQ